MVVQIKDIQPQISRRGILQLAAGTAFRSVLPPVAVSSPAMAASAEATVTRALAPLSARYAQQMTSSFIYVMWNMKDKDEVRKAKEKPEYYTDQVYLNDFLSYVENRIRNLFTFYVHYDDDQIRAFHAEGRSKSLAARARREFDDVYSHTRCYRKDAIKLDDVFASDQEFNQQTILKTLMDTLDAVLEIDTKQRQGILPFQFNGYGEDISLLDLLLRQSSVHSRYFFEPEKIKELTARQKIEQLLEFSHDRLTIPFTTLDLGHRFGWFYLADEQPISEKTLESELHRIHKDDFSVEKYRQRQAAFVYELDSFFARRSVRERLDMKASGNSTGNMQQPAMSVVQALPVQSTVITRGIDAIRRVFSHVGTDAANGVVNIIQEDVQEKQAVEPVAQDFLTIENNPTQKPFQDSLLNTSKAVPVYAAVPKNSQP
ncbi:MAG: hypothetical protein ACK4NR_10340 [Micavibrio sp.]